jgi:transcriptional regulator with XRE-family HTH domain
MLDFQARLRDALRRRLYPNAPLHLKEIAGAIGRSENSLTRWWRGETGIRGEDLQRIARFFMRRGDAGFLRDVFGDLIAADAPLAAVEAAVIALVRDALSNGAFAGRGKDPFANDEHFWFTADGSIQSSPTGHVDYVRRTLRIPERAGDLTAYATRVLGWIALTERGDGLVVVRHDGRRVGALAAEQVCGWLEDRADRISHVRRSVHIDGAWVEAHHASARAAVAAIAKVAFIVRLPRRQWRVDQLPLDAIGDPRLGGLLQAYREAPHRIIHAAAGTGAFTTSSVFGIKGDDVVSHHVATGFGFDTTSVEGLNVLSRPDTDYALMVQARILRTRREGPTYYELAGTIDDTYVRYYNLALPEPGPEGRVLTSTVMLELERFAA